MISKARSAVSGLEKTYVELRNTAGRAEPTERLGSNPRVRTSVDERRSGLISGIILSVALGFPDANSVVPGLRRFRSVAHRLKTSQAEARATGCRYVDDRWHRLRSSSAVSFPGGCLCRRPKKCREE